MRTRPLSLTIVGWLFILVGVGGLIHGLLPLMKSSPSGISQHELRDAFYVLLSELLAISGGVLILRGSNWGRGLVVLWMAFHIVLSIMHVISELLIHCAMFAVILYFLLRPEASAYFRKAPQS